MIDIASQHQELVARLIICVPGSERARELRTMIYRLECIEPELERQRVDAMREKLRHPAHYTGQLA